MTADARPDGDTEERSGVRVRPYAMTGGRTRAATHLEIETILVATDLGRRQAAAMAHERGRIVRLCAEAMSVAEVSARLHLPLGVARVLAGDLVSEGCLDFNRDRDAGASPDVNLLERVFDGLRSL